MTVPPADELATITVEWDADGDDDAGEEQVPEVGVRWASNGRLPAVGDSAILFNDDRGDPHAVVFATGAALVPDSTAAVAALDARVDALETETECGTATITFTASDTSATTSIPHNLGVVPKVQLTAYNNLIAQIVSKSATHIDIRGYVPDGAVSGTFNIDWEARKP